MQFVDALFGGVTVLIWLAIVLMALVGEKSRAIKSMFFGVRWTLVGVAVGIGGAIYEQTSFVSVQLAYLSGVILTIAVMEYVLRRGEDQAGV